jgi:hypothetical protein
MYSHARKYQNDFELAHAIYGVSGSAVGAKLAEDSGNAFVSSTTGNWYETSFSYTCAANTSYFLMFWGSSPHRYRYDTATTGDGCSGPTNATFETWPTSSFSVNNRVVSIYAVYGSISQTVNIDTSRGVMDSASFNADTKRRIAESASFGADTLREVIDEIEVGMNADTLRSIIDDVAIAADTRRRVYEAEISTILVDTKREVVTRYHADKSPLAIHFFPVGLRISPYTLEPGKYKKGTANLTPNSNQLVNRLWVKGGKTTSDPYSQPITVGTEPIPLLYSPRAPVTVIIGGVEKSLGIQNITEEGTCDFLLNVAEKLLVPDLCTSGSGTITYKYEYPIKILLEEPTSQAQYGAFEDILNVNTDDKMLALELGYQHLFKYSQPVISGSIEPFAGIYRPGDLVKTTIPELNIDQYLEVKEVLYDSVPGKSHVNIRLQLESPERDLSNVLKDLSKRIFQLEKAALRDEEGPVEFYISREESVFWMEENERVPAIEFHAVVRWAESMERVPSINLQETVYWSEHFEQVFSEDVAAESTEWAEDVDVEIYSLLPSETLYPDEDLYPM